MDFGGIPSSVGFLILTPVFLRSQFGEFGSGLTYRFAWLFLD